MSASFSPRSSKVLQQQLEARTQLREPASADDITPLDIKWWNQQHPAIDLASVQIDCRSLGIDLAGEVLTAKGKNSELVADTRRRDAQHLLLMMQDRFERLGAVVLTNTGIENAAQLQAAVRMLKPQTTDYEGGTNPRSALTKEANVFDTGAPGPADLHYHQEMAYLDRTVTWIAFGCLNALGGGGTMRGATFISDVQAATRKLMQSPTGLGQKLREKGICYVRKLPDRAHFDARPELDTSVVFNFWQQSCGTECPEEAQKKMEAKGLSVDWEESPMFGRYMITRYYCDAFEYEPHTGENLLFSSIANDHVWFQSWAGLAELPAHERPLRMTFGDDTAISRAEKEEWVDAFDQFGAPLAWRKGDVAILCNYRWAHGRPAYHAQEGEKRELGVILGETFDRKGSKEVSSLRARL